eukprot:1023114-Prymnesium_polylepis.1
MRASPLMPTPLARTFDLPPNPDTFRGGLPGALHREHPPATSEDAQTDSSHARPTPIHFNSQHMTHF